MRANYTCEDTLVKITTEIKWGNVHTSDIGRQDQKHAYILYKINALG